MSTNKKMITEQKKKEDVCKILKRQIICNKKEKGIWYDSDSNVIRTGQKYYSSADEDMSEFSIEFYKIIYSDILCGDILRSDGRLVNYCFAGDTINSFNSIANLVREAGRTIKERKETKKEDWPDWLREYDNQYHCLANFWVLPASLGRKGKKRNYYDSIDIFLEKLNGDYRILEEYSNYVNAIPTPSDFNKIHHITDYSINMNTLSMYKEKKAEELIRQAQNMINVRAYEISTSEHWEDLWNYFNKKGLC